MTNPVIFTNATVLDVVAGKNIADQNVLVRDAGGLERRWRVF